MKQKPTYRNSSGHRRSSLLVLAASAAMTLGGAAADFTWTQSAPGDLDWNDSLNWNAGSVMAAPGTNADNLSFFADTATPLAAGASQIVTNVPSALTLRSLVLQGAGASAGASTEITIGTSASTWTMDRSDTGNVLITLEGTAGTAGLSYNVESNIVLVNDSLTIQGGGTAGFRFNGSLTRAGRALRKEGTSVATLSGAITGTSDFEVYAGTLNITGSLHTSAAAGKVVARGANSVLNLSGTGFAGSAGLGVEGTNSLFNITGALTVTGTTVFVAPDANQTGTLNITGGLVSASGKNIWLGSDGYNGASNNTGHGILNLSGGGLLDAGGTAGTFRIGGSRALSVGGTGTLNLEAGGALQINRAVGFGTNASSGTLNFNGGSFIAGGAGATISATSAGRINVRNGGAFINTGGFNIAITEELQHSAISGDNAIDGGLSKSGFGVLALATLNTYTGPTVIEGGILRFPKTTSLYSGNTADWTTANLNVMSSATIAFNVGGDGEFGDADITLLLANLASSSDFGDGMNDGAGIGFDTTNALSGFTLANNISDTAGPAGGSRSLVKLGANALTLTGNNTHTGGTTVHGGTLVIGNSNAIGSGVLTVATTAATTLVAGVDLTGADALSNDVVLSTATRIDGTHNLELRGTITRNNSALAKYGTGSLTLTGEAFSGTGDFETYAGTTYMTGTWGAGFSAGKVTARGATGGVLNWSGTGYAGGVYGVGAEEGGGVINITAGLLSSAATTSAVFIAPFAPNSSAINVSGGTLAVTGNGAIRIGAGGYNGATANGVSTMTVSGTGVFESGTTTGVFAVGSSVAGNTVGTGTLNLDPGGTVATNRIITSGSVASGTFNFNGGTFRANGTEASISLNAASGRANVRNGGAFIDSNGFDISLPQSLVHSNIEGDAAGDGGLAKNGTGKLTLLGTNTYTGPTQVNAGNLVIGHPDSIPNGAAGVTVAAGAGFGVHAANFTSGQIESIASKVVWSGTGTSSLVLDTQGGNVTVGADFAAGGYNLLATGGGTLTLSGDVSGVTVLTENGTQVIVSADVAITVNSFKVEEGTTPATRKAVISFTASGAVDIYASGDLQNWGTAIATGVSASPFIEDNLGQDKRFYILVPAGAPAP
ncbi:autotransporter-associated beta strand repeat-containing protein [Luteolibacter yonseiensis]|uniref:Autotransporter-associated beta strand repeat-containing protein n=1 Tax=Luteolibacter yonseiensis TaxID=1144680 RepID=A0A934VA09_9BACT|nr:autotransporter-associated beta strand repeat-containing protein [Luteolibacter yonseiensis]MBK1815723.1 autotransporter-associated beta strand repeat-containing protein [Luteolibacter yonseiensis]